MKSKFSLMFLCEWIIFEEGSVEPEEQKSLGITGILLRPRAYQGQENNPVHFSKTTEVPADIWIVRRFGKHIGYDLI